jgi:hypothetical protein
MRNVQQHLENIHPKCCYKPVYCCLIRWVIVVLFDTSLLWYALLNILRRAPNDFGTYSSICWRMRTSSACEYTMSVPAQFLRTWNEQRPNNCGDIDSSVIGEVRSVYYMRVYPLLISMLCRTSWLLLDCVSNCTPCTLIMVPSLFLIFQIKHMISRVFTEGGVGQTQESMPTYVSILRIS